MINRITYSVVFPTNSVSLKGVFSPQPGITAVVGENGSGKTFTSIELTRYLLFGKTALRGEASDYKKLEAEGEFVINGHTYVVSRTAKKETVKDESGTILAVGAEEVTKKMTELLGYGLKVFDIANASVQKNADIFGKMPPSERKRRIDEVVGLTTQETVEKACKAEGVNLQREAEALTRTLTPPVKPKKPAGYIKSEKLQAEYDALNDIYTKAQALTRQLAPAFEPEKPPVERPNDGDLSALIAAQDEYHINARERKRLATIIASASPVSYSEEQLEAAAQRITVSELVASEVTCPDCGSKFVPGHGHLAMPEGPDLTRNQIRAEMEALRKREEVAAAREALDALPELNDLSEALADMQAAEAQWQRYDTLAEASNAQRKRNLEVEKGLRELGEVPAEKELAFMREQIYEFRTYEREQYSYETDKANFDARSTEIAELTRRSEAFKKGSVDLAKARAAVKGYLAPRISEVASNLINVMTAGKLNSVVVDEDMNIKVNNQKIETLSGGGETVANIALRLALGQVLVASTFSVFLGDEMDSDADDARRETVGEALVSLIENNYLKQVILVTHRGVEKIADHVRDMDITE